VTKEDPSLLVISHAGQTDGRGPAKECVQLHGTSWSRLVSAEIHEKSALVAAICRILPALVSHVAKKWITPQAETIIAAQSWS